MSRNFEVLCRVQQDKGSALTESKAAVPAIPKHEFAIASGWQSCIPAIPEIVKLVHVLFLSSANAPHHVLFCGVGALQGSGMVCASVAKALSDEVTSRVCLVDARSLGSSLQPLLDLEESVYPSSKSVAPLGPIARQVERNLWLVSGEDLSLVGGSNGGAEQLCSNLLALRKEFGYVLISAPALGGDITAAVLGQVTDGVVLILEANATRKVIARGAKQTLDAANVRLLGTVLSNRTYPIPEKIYRRL